MPASGSTIDSTGTWIFRSSGLRTPVSTTGSCAAGRPGSGRPPPAGSASPTGRCAGRRARACSSSRSSVSARCAPRLVCATAWISSTITDSAPREDLARLEVSIRYSDSGVVIRMSGGCASMSRRSLCGVSPVRIATLSVGADPAQRRAQVALDVVGERLQRRDVDEPRALVRSARASEAVQRPQERRQRLARAGRRRDQHVLAGRDRRPRLRLRRRRLLERALEPLADLRG